MRILQIIDSLEAGGSERMAVNYANELAKDIEFSGIVVTRKEGSLLSQINDKTHYFYLNKKSLFDLRAIIKLRRIVVKNKINIIHVHSTSFFIAFLIKMTKPSLKLIWHDHYGDSEFLEKRPMFALRIIIPFFYGVIAVNNKLKYWAQKKLKKKNTIYLPNFASFEFKDDGETMLNGTDGKRIVCLANLRKQKNHFLIIDAAQKLKISYPDWTFHFVGKDFEDDYAAQIKNLIVKLNLENHIFLYGSKNDIKNILNQSEIGVLTSVSEGLPVSILEYGLSKMPIIVSNVGEIPNFVVSKINGYVFQSNDSDDFYKSLVDLIENKKLRFEFGSQLYNTVEENFSHKSIIKQYLKWLKE